MLWRVAGGIARTTIGIDPTSYSRTSLVHCHSMAFALKEQRSVEAGDASSNNANIHDYDLRSSRGPNLKDCTTE